MQGAGRARPFEVRYIENPSQSELRNLTLKHTPGIIQTKQGSLVKVSRNKNRVAKFTYLVATADQAANFSMQLIEPDVATVGLGMCASMGQFLLSSGTKGKRYLTSHARVLMHQPSGGIGGTATDVRINAELIMDMKKTMSELTAEQTGHTLEEIYRDNEYDHWFTAQEALDYGFVDKLVTTPDTIGNNQQGE